MGGLRAITVLLIATLDEVVIVVGIRRLFLEEVVATHNNTHLLQHLVVLVQEL